MASAAQLDVVAIIDQQPVRAYHYWIAGLCAATVLMDGFDMQAIGFVAPALAADWHMTRSALSPVLSSGLLGMLVGALFFGSLGDRWGRKRVLNLCTLWFGVGSLLTAQAGSVNQMLLLGGVLLSYSPGVRRVFLVAAIPPLIAPFAAAALSKRSARAQAQGITNE